MTDEMIAEIEHRLQQKLSQSRLEIQNEIGRLDAQFQNRLSQRTLAQTDGFRQAIFPKSRIPGTKHRILFVAHGYPPEQIGGTEVYNQRIADALNQLSDFESVVLSRGVLKDQELLEGSI